MATEHHALKSMVKVDNKNEAKKQSGLTGGPILAGVIYVATALAILGFFWQSVLPLVRL
jgi:hypothetical protein